MSLSLDQIHSDEASGKSCLVVLEAYPKDSGRYELSVRNAAGEARASCDVVVKARPLPSDTSDSESTLANRSMEPRAPRIQLPLKDIVVADGASARLDCVIVGQPEPEVIFKVNSKVLKKDSKNTSIW